MANYIADTNRLIIIRWLSVGITRGKMLLHQMVNLIYISKEQSYASLMERQVVVKVRDDRFSRTFMESQRLSLRSMNVVEVICGYREGVLNKKGDHISLLVSHKCPETWHSVKKRGSSKR